MPETVPRPNHSFSPSDMARLTLSKQTATTKTNNETLATIPHPQEGSTYEENGRNYRFVPATYTISVRDLESRGGFREVERPYSLRSWFSHTTKTPDGFINGPGWDRLNSGSLSDYTPDQMLRRFGHVFSTEELRHPAGKVDWETGERTDGMPDNIPYFGIEPIN